LPLLDDELRVAASRAQSDVVLHAYGYNQQEGQQ
jgi:hypothetical protein